MKRLFSIFLSRYTDKCAQVYLDTQDGVPTTSFENGAVKYWLPAENNGHNPTQIYVGSESSCNPLR